MTRREFIGGCTAVAAGVSLGNPVRGILGGRRDYSLKGSLPFDSEVEYIESTGEQWIDTGCILTSNSHLTIRMSDYLVPGAWMFGARRAYLQNAIGVYADAGAANNEFRFAFGTYLSEYKFTYTTRSDIVGITTIDINAGLLTITRERIPNTYRELASKQSFVTPCPFYLFTMNQNGLRTNISHMRWYGASIDSMLELVPVRYTNEYGETEGALYDRLSGYIFRNQGTGSFLIGPDVIY